jgi:hypothetical protein
MNCRETQKRTQSNVFSVREVTRDITQRSDGTIKTLETETIKEQAFIQQEEIQKEFSIAKELLLNRRMNEWNELTTTWRQPPPARRKIIDERRETVADMVIDGDIPTFTGTFESALAEQRAQIEQSCATFDSFSVILDPVICQKVKNCKKPAPNDEVCCSVYFSMAVFRLELRLRYKKQLANIVARLDQQKKVPSEPPKRGTVLRRETAPLMPFTAADDCVADASQQADKTAGGLETYLLDCFLGSPAALAPVLGNLLSAAILGRIVVERWPKLVRIDGTEECSLHRFPLTPVLFWGKSQTEKEWFANCTFRVGEVVYENVWVELPVLCASREYGDRTVRHFQDSKQQDERRSIGCIRDVADLLQQVPHRHEEFNKLRRMQSELSGLLEIKEDIAELNQRKRELSSTLNRLQTKSRRL